MSRSAAYVFIVALCAGLSTLLAAPAQAQLSRGNLRLSIDGDMFSVAGVDIGGGKNKVIGLGPNQRGGSRLSGEPTPIGLGVGYVLQHNLILGVRFGLGYDVIAPDGGGSNTRLLGLSLMPGITFVPTGDRTKLFITAAPIFQVSRAKTDNARARTLLGGIDLGVGVFIFVTNALSVDLGFHFEGRFGNTDYAVDNLNHNPNNHDRHQSVTDLRGVLRLGFSLWT
jgi:hypothetical protein